MVWMFWLVYAINVVFYQKNGISISQITIIDVIWAIAAFLMEVPTGILADRWSRKYMLALSSLFAGVGFLIFFVSGNFFPFVIATIFMAARHAFASGTSNALLYDSLKSLKRENEFEKILGRSRLLGVVSISIAGILGSLVANYSIRLPFILSIIPAIVGVFIALSFKEPEIHSSTEEVKFFDHLKKSIRVVLTHPLIRFVFLYLILMDIAISYMDEYDQLYLAAINFPLVFFGIWIGLRRGLGGIGGYFAEKFKNKSSANIKLFSLATMFCVLAAIGLGGKILGLVAFLLIFPIWGIAEVLVWGEIHSQVESCQRATIESLIVFFGIVIDIPARLGFGFISQSFGIKAGYLYVLGILVLYLPFFLLKKSNLLILTKGDK